MKISLFFILMMVIVLSALAVTQFIVAILAFGLLMTGVFIYRFQSHPTVQEWLEKHF